jgi:hypothetical protein
VDVDGGQSQDMMLGKSGLQCSRKWASSMMRIACILEQKYFLMCESHAPPRQLFQILGGIRW